MGSGSVKTYADLPLLLKSREVFSTQTPCLNGGSIVSSNKQANNLFPIVSSTKVIGSLIVVFNFVFVGFDTSIMAIVPFYCKFLFFCKVCSGIPWKFF